MISNLFLFFNYAYVFESVSVCGYVYMSAGANSCQNSMWKLPDTELQVIVNFLVRVL